MPVPTTGQDRPDFIDTVGVSAIDLFTAFGVTALPLDTGIIDVRIWPILSLRFQTAAGLANTQVTATFYNDLAGTRIVGIQTWMTFNNIVIVDSLVIEGPYMRVTVTQAGPGNVDIVFVVRGKNPPMMHGQGVAGVNVNPQQLCNQDYGPVGIGAVTITNAAFVQRAWATMFLLSDAQAVQVTAQAMDVAGVWHNIASIGPQVAAGPARASVHISIPSHVCRIIVENLSGGACNLGAGIVLAPTP